MANAYVSVLTSSDPKRTGVAQARTDVTATGSWPGAVHVTVAAGGYHVRVYLSVACYVYVGPSSSSVVWGTNALALPAGEYTFVTAPAQVVAIKTI